METQLTIVSEDANQAMNSGPKYCTVLNVVSPGALSELSLIITVTRDLLKVRS